MILLLATLEESCSKRDQDNMYFQGVTHSGTQFACVQGWGFQDHTLTQQDLNEMQNWNINIVRVPLNQHCWLGINGIPDQYSGSNYRNAIKAIVSRLNTRNFHVILQLHWSRHGNQKATGQQPMPNIDHSIQFWKSCSTQFRNNQLVIFELFNQPYPNQMTSDYEAAWRCLRDGGRCPGIEYQVAGMQVLVNSVRSTGLSYSNDLTRMLDYMPNDPQANLGVSFHVYNINYCNTMTCFQQTVDVVSKKYPIFVTEFGEIDCEGWFVRVIEEWLKNKNYSRLAWTYNVWDCKQGPSLISDYKGGRTVYGESVFQMFKKKSESY